MKSASWPWRRRSACCVWSRKARSFASAVSGRSSQRAHRGGDPPRSAEHGRTTDVSRRPVLPPLSVSHRDPAAPRSSERYPRVCRILRRAAPRTASVFVRCPFPTMTCALLAKYQWPGNVREMAAVMDRAVLIGQGRALNVAAALGQGILTANRLQPPVRPSETAPCCHRAARRRDSASYRGRARRQTHGRVEGPHGAARLLKINPHTLRARMRKLKIDWRGFALPAG